MDMNIASRYILIYFLLLLFLCIPALNYTRNYKLLLRINYF